MTNTVLIPVIVDRNWQRTERRVLDGKGMDEKIKKLEQEKKDEDEWEERITTIRQVKGDSLHYRAKLHSPFILRKRLPESCKIDRRCLCCEQVKRADDNHFSAQQKD
jgi:hypothetical protein